MSETVNSEFTTYILLEKENEKLKYEIEKLKNIIEGKEKIITYFSSQYFFRQGTY